MKIDISDPEVKKLFELTKKQQKKLKKLKQIDPKIGQLFVK
jgi:hypothetical protein